MEKICLIGKGLLSYLVDFKRAFDKVLHEYIRRCMEELKVTNEYMLCRNPNLQEDDMSCM